jgi:serine/threonine-protein kinase RsbW
MSARASAVRSAGDEPPEVLRAEHPAVFESVPLLLAFIDEACAQHHVDRESAFAVRLAVDEVCTNLVRHGYAGRAPGPIAVTFSREAHRVVVTISNRGHPFDPARAPPPDLATPAETRRVGGLGWHLVKHVVDHIEYRSDAEVGNRLTLVKGLREPAG